MGQISRLMVGLAVLAGTALGAPAQAQIEAPANFKTDTDPKLQGRTSILEAFDVDTSKLPKGSVINRVRAKDGSIDELRLTVPARITVNWQAPTRQSKTCDIKLTMVRTGARPGAQGQPPNSQHVFSSGVINHWAGAFWMPIRNGKISASNPVEWPEEGYPNEFAGNVVMVPGPNCDLVSEIGFTITQNDPPYIEQRKEMIEQEVPEALMKQALEMMLKVGGASPNPFGKTVPYNQYMRTACHSGGFPVLRVDDGNPETFLMTFEGRHEDEDRTECPLIAAKGYIHVGDAPKPEKFQFLASYPEPDIRFRKDGTSFVCSNNDPVNPLVRFEFTTDILPSSIEGNVILEKRDWTGNYSPIEADFETFDDTYLILSPGVELEPLRHYRVRVLSGKDGLTGVGDDDYLVEDLELEFQTAPAGAGQTFETVFRNDSDMGVYQVSRGETVLPGKETFTRTFATYPAKDAEQDQRDMPEEVCMALQVVSEAKGSAGRIELPKIEYFVKRSDLITDADKKNGSYKALTQGWYPKETDGGPTGSRLMKSVLTPINFSTAVPGGEAPTLEIDADKPTPILKSMINLKLKVFTGKVNITALDSVVAAITEAALGGQVNSSGEFSRSATDKLKSLADTLSDGNEQTPKVVEELLERRIEISQTLADYMPLNGSSMYKAGSIDMELDFNRRAWAFWYFEINEKKITDNLTNQFLNIQETKVLPNCRGLEICVLTVPWAWGGAQASTDAGLKARGLIVGSDATSPKVVDRLDLTITHEIGHDFGLAHAPNDFNTKEEQDRIAAALSSAKVRWPGIEAMFRHSDGKIAYRSSKDGNSESVQLYPFVYNTLVHHDDAALPKDQYRQMLEALLNPYSGAKKYYGAYAAGAHSSNAGLDAFNWRDAGSLYESGQSAVEIYPILRTALSSASEDEGEHGIAISLIMSSFEGKYVAPFLPTIARGRALDASPDLAGTAVETIALKAIDAAGNVLGATDIDLPAPLDTGTPGANFRLHTFLPLSEDLADRAATLQMLDANGEIFAEATIDTRNEADLLPEPALPENDSNPDFIPELNQPPTEPVSPLETPNANAPVVTNGTRTPAAPQQPAKGSATAPPVAASQSQSGGLIGSCGMTHAEVKRLVDHQMSGLEGMSGVGNVDQLKAELLASYLAPDYPKDNLCEMRKELPAE